MKFAFAAFASAALAIPAQAVSLYLVGDSTMASHSASEGIQGYVQCLLSLLTVIITINLFAP
jgi:hypothetical protein